LVTVSPEFVVRLTWGWRIDSQESSLTGMAPGCGLCHRVARISHITVAGFPQSMRSKSPSLFMPSLISSRLYWSHRSNHGRGLHEGRNTRRQGCQESSVMISVTNILRRLIRVLGAWWPADGLLGNDWILRALT
jgi:hypothetical protein